MDAKTSRLKFDQEKDIYIVAKCFPQNNLEKTKGHHLNQVIKNITLPILGQTQLYAS